ncbi:MAG TPA: hypothetical protein VGI91_09155 [Steroidobacteraceae bacterium]|jgi:hypothetical protein
MAAIVAIATEPDPVDGLADMLTHTTLTADAQRNAAKDTPADSSQVRLLKVLEQNAADAWALAERWVNEPTRVAYREKILAWPGPRPSAVAVAFVRLSDIKRSGAASVESGDGITDSLRAATEQIDQTRLFAERSLYLAQRFPFLMRWQAEVYTLNTLGTQESEQTQARIEEMTTILGATSKTVAGMAEQLSRERQAALGDLFGRIRAERQASLDQVEQIVQNERKATLVQASAAIDAQRKALLNDLLELTSSAERTGSGWIGRTVLIGTVLIVILMLALLGTMLLYRRLTHWWSGKSSRRFRTAQHSVPDPHCKSHCANAHE